MVDRFTIDPARGNMADHRKFVSGIVPSEVRSEPAWWFIFQENKLLVIRITRMRQPPVPD